MSNHKVWNALIVLAAALALVWPAAVQPAVAANGSSSSTSTQAGAGFDLTWLETGDCQAPPQEARPAMEYAAAQWAAVLASPVEIAVALCWTDQMPCDGIGCGGPSLFVFNPPNAPLVDTAYPIPLANALAGRDIHEGVEITIAFKASYDWDFTIEPPGNFAAVALHELGHGLGFYSSMYESYNIGFCGDGPFGFLYPCPMIYDRFVVDSQGVSLLDYKSPDPRVLAQKLKSDANFGGPNTLLRSGGTDARLYTPVIFEMGVSLTHLDDATFDGTPDGLMTSTGAGNQIGPVTRGIFQDMGWQLADGSPNLSAVGPSEIEAGSQALFQAELDWAAYAGGVVTYTWQIEGQQTVTHTAASITDTLSVTWETSGPKKITVTASTGAAAVGTTRLVRAVRQVYLPLVAK